ncbi:MAG: hypothetical protein QOE11_120 [Solirubrobacteraceae bacterium]|jgi:hypothetical protein|nr:hypothetical protein [Solirubrobacteraceae bacterium]
MARRLADIARQLGDRFRWPSGRPPYTGAAVPAC